MSETLLIILQCITTVITIIGVIYVAIQFRTSKKITRGQFWLSIDAILSKNHSEVHQNLRPGGKWIKKGEGPKSAKEWIDTENYLGLFERINVFIEDGILDLQTFKRFYGYRVKNIFFNSIIRETKLKGELSKHWKDLIELGKKIGYSLE